MNITSYLTKNDLLFLMIFLLILLINSSWVLYAFYRNYSLTGKITPYIKQKSFSHLLRMRITDALSVTTIIVALYYLLFKKGLTPFLAFLLILLLIKSLSHILLVLNSYNLIFKNTNTLKYNEKTIYDFSLANNIYGQIVTFITSAYVIFKLF